MYGITFGHLFKFQDMIKALDVGHPKIAELKVKRNPQYFLSRCFFQSRRN